jgi:chromate transporter
VKEPLLLEILRRFAGISLVAIGGANAVIPEIHRQIVDHLHWMDDRTFVGLIGVAQTAPGPNVMIVSLIGWHMAGAAGFALATLGMILPSSLLAFGVGRLAHFHTDNAAWRLAKRVLAPLAVGLILASGAVMARASDHSATPILITVGMTLLTLRTALNPLIGILAAALVGLCAGRFGIALM